MRMIGRIASLTALGGPGWQTVLRPQHGAGFRRRVFLNRSVPVSPFWV